MPRATIRLHGELEDLLPAARRRVPNVVDCPDRATLKHAIEALGVPHVEIGTIVVDGRPADAAEPVRAGTSVDVHPVGPRTLDPPRFVADAHLGGLARRLRLLGFDCTLAREHDDAEIAASAHVEARAVLSRDRGLLMHRRIASGRYVRATDVDAQTREVLDAFALRERARPFTRCLECNGTLRPTDAAEAGDRLPPSVAARAVPLTRCSRCARLYWPGSHWQRLRATADRLLGRSRHDAVPPRGP